MSQCGARDNSMRDQILTWRSLRSQPEAVLANPAQIRRPGEVNLVSFLFAIKNDRRGQHGELVSNNVKRAG